MYNHKASNGSPRSDGRQSGTESTWGTLSSCSSYQSTPPLSPLILPSPNGYIHPTPPPSLLLPHPSLTLSSPSLRSFTIHPSSSTPLHPTPSHPTTHPPTAHLRLLFSIHPSWSFSLYASSDIGYVTIQDVLFGLISFLNKADRGDVEKSRILGLGNLGIGFPSTHPHAYAYTQGRSHTHPTHNINPNYHARSNSSHYPLGQRTYEARDAQLRQDPSANLTRLALLGSQTTFLGLSTHSESDSLVIHLR